MSRTYKTSRYRTTMATMMERWPPEQRPWGHMPPDQNQLREALRGFDNAGERMGIDRKSYAKAKVEERRLERAARARSLRKEVDEASED
jgi:hypothetical protein